ncbi:bromodomain-containing protein [Rhizophagus clarus]|uniref:Bromodomain-containing protein n=1 Tax=Rhizophagus clarus TaxID=94130 RepID=A0A8H3QYX1_9GLOM|nr:bromodomain-containing protein [Rhizophagus clarus]
MRVIAEHLQHKRNLQTFWQEIIKEYKKENQENSLPKETPKERHTITAVKSLSKETSKDHPTVTVNSSLLKETIDDQILIPTVISVTSFPKETIKTSVKNLPETLQQNFSKKNNKLINFCYDILHKLEDNPYAHLFYKYNEENIDKIIEDPMDLFTVNSKLKNNQYTNLEEFENDNRLIFRNCYTYNYVKSEIYCSGKALEIDFNKKWNEKLIFQTRKKGELKRVRDNDTNIDNSRFQKKQNQILEENKNNIIYQQVINDVFPVASVYENLVIDIFVLKGIGDNYTSLELKYISLVGLIQNQNTKYGANELENLDKILEKENEEFLLKRPYTYWSKNTKKQIKQL